jgi:outer membrane protein OmpA-like peptidoglycan-associated protein
MQHNPDQNIQRIMSPDLSVKWVFLLLGLPLALFGQTKDVKDVPIYFNNPSFEDLPKPSQSPMGWYDCGKSGESPPDIQPGYFDVSKPASNGNSYIGLVVRDNDTWEAIGQRLSKPLEASQCYEFGIDLARSEIYLSPSRLTLEKVNFVAPAKIRIWGGMGYCDKAEMLFETPIIVHNRWLTYNIRISPKKGNYTYLMIEAYYKTPVLFPYNGNVLLDNLTPIKKVTCGPDKMPDPKPKVVAKAVPSTKPTTSTKPATTPVKPDTAVKKPEPKPSAVVKIERGNVKKGKVFRLEKVYFDANKFEIKPESEAELTELYQFLEDNKDIVVEVGGHTNNKMWPNEDFANELSTNRAKAVADWLIAKGIPAERVQYKGYGWKHPIEANTTEAGKKKNQRVEVKILTLNG